MSYRSLLFMPGNHPEMLFNADRLGADGVIFDLEDAVAPQQKREARFLVQEALKSVPRLFSKVLVRINGMDTPYWKEDLAALAECSLDGLVIPKAAVDSMRMFHEEVQSHYMGRAISDVLLYPLIESARGILEAQQVAASSEHIAGLLLGGEDYTRDLGIERTKKGDELAYARTHLLTVAHAYGLEAIDTPYTDVDDLAGLAEDTKHTRSLGMTGRLVISPSHISTVHAIFSPTKEAIAEARALLSAAEEERKEGRGVFRYQGKMVDQPVIARAEHLLQRAEEWGLLE